MANPNTNKPNNNFFIFLFLISNNNNVKFIYGDRLKIDIKGNILARKTSTGFSKLQLFFKSGIPQETVFFRREIYDKIGQVNVGLNFSLDYEYWIRVSKRYKIL